MLRFMLVVAMGGWIIEVGTLSVVDNSVNMTGTAAERKMTLLNEQPLVVLAHVSL